MNTAKLSRSEPFSAGARKAVNVYVRYLVLGAN